MSDNQRIPPSLSEEACLQQVLLQKQRGFTLLEVMIVLAILGVMLGIAVPTFKVWSDNSAVNNATTTLFVKLKQARTLAVAESRSVKVSFGSNTFTYDDYSHASSADCSRCKNEVISLAQFSPDLTVTGPTSFKFSNRGTSNAGTVKLVIGDYRKCIKVNIIGKAHIESASNATGDCPP